MTTKETFTTPEHVEHAVKRTEHYVGRAVMTALDQQRQQQSLDAGVSHELNGFAD
ncbi:MAG: hypothetical protein M3Q79_00345 [bacterium]|nr:hypothetical protein [bacterium]